MEAEAAKEHIQPGLMRYDVVMVENGKVFLRYCATSNFHTASNRLRKLNGETGSRLNERIRFPKLTYAILAYPCDADGNHVKKTILK